MPSDAPLPPPHIAALPPAIRPLEVLYADDVPQLRDLLTLILRRDGHQCETVAHGADALARITRPGAAYDLVITDHHMPGINGLELVRRARAARFAGKIIIFSSELDPAVHREYLKYDVALVLSKPVFPSDFRRVLREQFAAHYPPVTAGTKSTVS